MRSSKHRNYVGDTGEDKWSSTPSEH